MSRKRPQRRSENDVEGDDDVTCIDCQVFFYADVSPSTILKMIKALKTANENSVKTIGLPCVYMFIHSNGGDAFAGLSAMDHIRNNPIPVITIADGMVASAASFMLLAGRTRYILPHAFVRIHQLSISGFDGKYAELMDEMQNTKVLMETIRNMYTEHTNMSEERVEEILKKEIDMDALCCLKEGIVHAVFQA